MCECEHEQIIFFDVHEIFGEYYLTHGTKYLVMWKNILSCVQRITTFMDEIVDEKWKNFLMNIDNICLLCENLNKRNKVEFFYVGLF
jgi:hypothetical protein